MSVLNAYINPPPSTIMGFGAFQLNNQAQALSNVGDHEGAERLHLQALAIKEEAFGKDSIQVALTRNALGEVQLLMGKLEEAENNLEIAVRIRNESLFESADAAVSRENLAQVYEAKGNVAEAKRIRLSGAPSAMVCSNFKCPQAILSRSALSQCKQCKCAYYCSKACQRRDWVTRHRLLCRAPE